MRESVVQAAGEGVQRGRLLPGQLGRARITVRPGRPPGGGRGRTPFAVLVVVLLAAGLLGLLMLNTALNEGSFELTKLQKQTTTQTDQQQGLQQQIDHAAAPDALEQRARQLGMAPGGDPAFLQDDGKVLGSPAAAKDSPPVKRTGSGLWPSAAQPTAGPASSAAPSQGTSQGTPPSPGAAAPPPAAPSSAAPGAVASTDPGATGEGSLRVDPVSPSPGGGQSPSPSPSGSAAR
ncbi:cell division protein FtsL [Kitasatospora sp. NBC_01287]|uniref:cell division protein FtsL n=1 Tax=Kitasatospora sp. NBC_01287 TaxID=2903573 RepID=UPI0022502594|nr:cell division protein FtsL [Kitasatospora sp. NBC_01287]MCX4749604.1 cell division protein FtsL [Kitasatospora sp. NBC_01287]